MKRILPILLISGSCFATDILWKHDGVRHILGEVVLDTVTVSSVSFGTNSLIYWNDDESAKSLEYTHPDGGTITVNAETYRMWKNVDSVAISNGQPVCIFAGSGRIASVKLADADDLTLNSVIGVYTAESALQPDSIGRVTVGTGAIHDAPLNSYMLDGGPSEGSKMYLGTTKGTYSTNSQAHPAENILVGICTYAQVPSQKYDMELAIHNIKSWSMLDVRYGAKLISTNENYTTTSSDSVMVMLSDAKQLTNTLPASASGTRYTVKRYGSNNVFVTSASLIDGTNSYRLGQNYQYINVISDGSRWHVIGE